MAKKSIDNFLNESIANHEWLDAKDKINAPFSDHLKYNKRPEIALQYDMPSLYPEIDVGTPKAIDPNKDEENKGKVAVVVNEIKRQIMAGKTLQHVKQTVIDKIPETLKSAAKEEILKVAAEFPLLGSVYVEPEVFKTATIKGCEAGAEFVKNSSRLALYAKKMASCGGCSLNRGGFCSVYKKALVEDIPYTKKTFDHYKNHLYLANKIASTHEITSKADLKKALLPQSSATREAKSYVYHDESKKYVGVEKSASETYETKERRDLARDLSLKLASGMTPEMFREYVGTKYSSAHKDVFKRYADLVGSLGNVFVELDVFNNITEAKDFVTRYPKAKYVLSSKPQTRAVEVFLGKKIVSSLKEIPVSEWKQHLKTGSYNQELLAKNPALVMKMAAFAKPVKVKTASEAGFGIEMLNDVEINGFNPQNHVNNKFVPKAAPIYNKKNVVVERTAKTATSVGAATPVTQEGKKVAAKLDAKLSIDLEPTDFDESVKKYL